MRYTRVTAADRSHCLPRKQRADPAADAIVLEAGADSSVHHDVRVDSVVGIHAHRILPLEVAKVGRNCNILLSGSHPPLIAIAIAVPSNDFCMSAWGIFTWF